MLICEFEAHRYGETLGFVGLNVSPLTAAAPLLTVRDISYAFENSRGPDLPAGDDMGDWFAIDGHFCLPTSFDSNHPVMQSLVALGFDESAALTDIRLAIAAAKGRCDG